VEWSECWRIFEWSIIVVSLCAFQISLGGTCVHGRGVWLNVGEKEGGAVFTLSQTSNHLGRALCVGCGGI
jgi:hypothetical protein